MQRARVPEDRAIHFSNPTRKIVTPVSAASVAAGPATPRARSAPATAAPSAANFSSSRSCRLGFAAIVAARRSG